LEKEESLIDFYSNDLAAHLRKNRERVFHTVIGTNFFLNGVLFQEGTWDHEIDFKRNYPVEPWQCIFLKPGPNTLLEIQ